MFTRLSVPTMLLLFGLVCAPRPCLAQVALNVKAPTEKELRADFKKGLKNKDPAVRIEAVVNYSEGTRQLVEEGGAEKLVARTLAGALDDDNMGVCTAALTALSFGRHVTTVIEACNESLEYVRNIMEKKSGRLEDDESRERYRGAFDVYRLACAVLGNYRDDRSVDVLETELRALRPQSEPNSKGIGNVSQLDSIAVNLIRPATAALLALGTSDAVELVIKQTTVYSASSIGGMSPWEQQHERMARALHETLVDFAVRVERAPPAFTQNYQQDWHDWFKKNRKRFEDKLGKLKEPPDALDMEAMMGRGRRNANKPRRP